MLKLSTVVGSIIAKLQLNIDNFAANMKNAEKQLSDVEDKFSGFADIGSRFTDVGKSFSLGVTAPIVGLGAAIVKTTSDFDTSMSNVKAVSGATSEEFVKLRDKAQEMGSTTQFNATQAADAMGYMAMAGWNTSQIIDGLPGIMYAAAASGEDLATVSDIITDSMTAFGLKAADAAHFADVLAQASNASNTDIAMLGESFKYVAPLAGALGYSAEDTSIALGLMANAGIKAGQGGTALRAALTRMVKPTKDMSVLMDEYGISLTNSDGSMKSLSQVMEMLRTKLGGLDEATQAQAAATLFGQEAMSGMLAIINTSDSDFNSLSDAIYNADGAAESMAATMTDNLEGKIEQLMGALEGIAIQLGDILIPIITDVVQWLNKWADKFGGLDENTQKIILVMAGLAAAIGPTLIGIGNLITSVGKIGEAYDKSKLLMGKFKDMQALATVKTKLLAAAQAALNFVMSINPITLVIIAIVALVAAFVILWNKCEGFREFWINLWEGMKEAAGNLWEWLQEAGKNCVDWLVSIWDGIKGWWSGLWEWLKQAPQVMWDWMTNLFSNVWESMKSGWEAFKTGLQNMWISIKDWFVELWTGITDVFSTALGWVTETFSGSFDGMKQIWEGVKQYFTGAWEVIKNIFAGALLILLDLITLDFGQMKSDIANIGQNIQNGLKMMWDGISNIFQGSLTAIKEFWSTSWTMVKNKAIEIWTSIIQFFKDTGKNISDGFKQWLTDVKQWWSDTWTAVQNKAKEIWNDLITYLKNTWTNIGTSISTAWSNFKTTIFNKCTEIKNSIVSIWNSIITWFTQLPGRLYQIGSDMFTSMKNGINATIHNVTSAVTNGVQSAINYLTALPGQAVTWGRHMIEGFIDGIKKAVGKLMDTVKGVAEDIRDFLGFSIPKKGPLHVYMEWMPHMMEGMSDSLKANQHKLVNAAKNVAGSLSDAVNSDVGLAIAGDVAVTSPSGRVSSYSTPTEEESTMKKLLSELKSLNNRTSEYNINIEQVNADDPNDIRKLAEELEAFKENNKTF